MDTLGHASDYKRNALNDLKATRALQPSNWIDIAKLLTVETINVFDVTDEDIFQSVLLVMDVKRLRERTAGGNDDDVDVPTPRRTHREALQVALTSRKYIGAPFARKLEVMLGSLGQQTRAVEMLRGVECYGPLEYLILSNNAYL